MTALPSEPPCIFTSVPLADIERGNALLAGYLAGDPAVTAFFDRMPADILSPTRQPSATADRAQLARTLGEFQQTLGADSAAVRAAGLLANPATPVVTVGQQPGLLTGPLYTIYKAVTAINTARRLTAESGRPAVAVFWAGTDDDDRAEVDHCAMWDRHYALHAIRYPDWAGAPGQLVGDLPAGDAGRAVLEQAAAALADQPHTDDCLRLLEETLRDSLDYGGWFCRLLARLLSPHGLVVCDPRLPELRRLARTALRREICAPLASTAAVNRRAEEIHQAGYQVRLKKPADVCNFFLYDEVRRRVTYTDGRFHAGGRAFTPDEMLAFLEAHPERVIPNAVLRPLVQECLFSSAAFIAGPNELGYWAELQPVFHQQEIPMPAVLPRAAATLLSHPAAVRLRKLAITPPDLLFRYDQVRYAVLERAQPAALEQAFTCGRADIERLINQLVPAVSDVDATLAQSAVATHQRMLNELERLEKKSLKALERQASQHTEQLQHLQELLFPGQGTQERVLNLFAVLARYGFDLLAALPSLLDRQEGRHLFVEI